MYGNAHSTPQRAETPRPHQRQRFSMVSGRNRPENCIIGVHSIVDAVAIQLHRMLWPIVCTWCVVLQWLFLHEDGYNHSIRL